MQDKIKIRFSKGAPRRLNLIFKTAFVLLLGWMLYRHTLSKPDDLKWDLLLTADRFRMYWFWVVFAIALVPVNWILETLKWQCFLKAFVTLPFLRAFRAVLSGVAVSLLTPNRIGEYGGRILALSAGEAWGAAISSVLGSLCQWVVLLLGGVAGAYVIATHFTAAEPFFLKSFLFLGLGMAAFLTFALFNVGLAAGLARKLPGRRFRMGWMRKLAALRRYNNRTIATALGWAGLRYMVYCFQYYLLIRFFGIDVPAGMAAAGISAIFLAQTSLPLPPLAGVFARGELALAVWSHFSSDTTAILAAAYGLFIINLSLPSLMGAFIILKSNLTKLLRDEDKMLETHFLDTRSNPIDRI